MKRLTSLAFAFILTGCAARTPNTRAPAGEGPAKTDGQAFDLKAMLAREADGLKRQSVQGEGFRAQVLGSGKPKLSSDGKTSALEIPVGATSSVHCTLYATDVDPGATLFEVLKAMKSKLDVRQIAMSSVEVVQEAPVAGMSVLYVAETPKGKAAGQLKLAFHSRFGRPSLCLHDEVGYQRTFGAVARSFFESYTHAESSDPPRYVEVSGGTINGTPAGFDRTVVVTLPNGKKRFVTTGLMALLRSPSDLLASDQATILTVDGRGHIEEGRWIASTNNAAEMDIELKRDKGNAYRYSGTYKGKALSGSFKTQGQGLPGPLHTELAIAQRLAKKRPFTFSVHSYRPGDDPTRPASVHIARRADDPPDQLHLRYGDVEAIGLADAQGRMRESTLALGALTIELKRVFQRGEP